MLKLNTRLNKWVTGLGVIATSLAATFMLPMSSFAHEGNGDIWYNDPDKAGGTIYVDTNWEVTDGQIHPKEMYLVYNYDTMNDEHDVEEWDEHEGTYYDLPMETGWFSTSSWNPRTQFGYATIIEDVDPYAKSYNRVGVLVDSTVDIYDSNGNLVDTIKYDQNGYIYRAIMEDTEIEGSTDWALSDSAIGHFRTGEKYHERMYITNWRKNGTIYGSPSSVYWADLKFSYGGYTQHGYSKYYPIEGRNRKID
jgi:hypothetical protein